MKTSTVSKQQQSFLVLLLLQIIIMMMTALQHGVKAYVLRPTTSLLFRRTHKPASLVQIRQWSDDWTDSAPPPPRRKQRGDDYNPDGRRGGARQPRDNDNNFTGRGNNQFDNNNYNRNRGDFRRGGGGDNRRQRWSNERGPPNRNRNNNLRGGRREDDTSTKIDMKGLEAEGFVHIYGLAPTLSALKANRRDFAPKEQATNDIISREDEFRFDDDNEDDDFAAFQNEEETKPEAQFTSWLFLQDRSGSAGSSRSGDKAAAANEVKRLAEERGIPIHYTDKGSLNALSGNRPHQVHIIPCNLLWDFQPFCVIL